MQTVIRLQIIEDGALTEEDFSAAIAWVTEHSTLVAKRIALEVELPVTQITSLANLSANIERLMAAEEGGRIVFVDLHLTQAGLKTGDVVGLHNGEIPESLAFRLEDEDASRAGGYLVAWKALASPCPRQLIVFASSKQSEDSIRDRMTLMQETAGAWRKYEIYCRSS